MLIAQIIGVLSLYHFTKAHCPSINLNNKYVTFLSLIDENP